MPIVKEIKQNQNFEVKLNPVSKPPESKPAKVDGVPTWEVTSGDDITVKEATDGLSANLRSGDELGTTVVSVKADADMGEGVEEIEDTITVTVVSVSGEKADNLGLVAGEAVAN